MDSSHTALPPRARALPVISETELIFIMGKQTLLKGRLRAGAEKRSVFKLDS